MVIGDVNRRGGVFKVTNTINIIIFVVYSHTIHLNKFKQKFFFFFVRNRIFVKIWNRSQPYLGEERKMFRKLIYGKGFTTRTFSALGP